ncbi:MAG: hypothetical protein ABGX16_17655 [Pirellulales bacterium]
MKSFFAQFGLIPVLVIAVFALQTRNEVKAVGVLYNDPGWFYAYDGNEAFYNDRDGPNPDYINGDEENRPGGQSGEAALVFPGFIDPSCDPEVPGECNVDNEKGEWSFKSSQWDGSAPGDPLGSIPTGTPPLLPAAPGGVQTYTDGGTSYLRIQDSGQPASYGWTDKNAQAAPNTPRQEGNNRKIQFSHNMTRDSAFSDDPAILDNGITISFRARLATTATGPLDDLFPEGGTTLASTLPWPTDGFGSRVYNDGRGMFHLTQTGAGGEQQMAFSLMGQATIDSDVGIIVTKTGLVMNNKANSAAADDVDTNHANDATLNIVEIPSEDLSDWQEFWITIEALAAPVDNNTHEVNVYYNGEVTTPETFEIILADENEFNTGAFLGMGTSSGSAPGAFDVDFYAYSEGILIPTSAAVDDADFDGDGDVDGFDFLIWQRESGASGQSPFSPGDANGDGNINDVDLAIWHGQFGVAPLSAITSAVPEPMGLATMVLGLLSLAVYSTRRRPTKLFP